MKDFLREQKAYIIIYICIVLFAVICAAGSASGDICPKCGSYYSHVLNKDSGQYVDICLMGHIKE